ncbi:DUF1654 domain-containing protein [Pseudomonas syringae]|nr:DUF1654 domain-containing protein [Pseudomonas syringae]
MSSAQRKPAISPYQAMANRIQLVITSPSAQTERTACIYRSPDEDEAIWDQLIDELDQADSVRVESLGGNGVRVTWDPPLAD